MKNALATLPPLALCARASTKSGTWLIDPPEGAIYVVPAPAR